MPAPSPTPLKAAIFDLDGTLIDSAAELRAALNLALAKLARRPLAEREVRAMIGDGIVSLTERALAATGTALTGAALDEAVERVREAYAGTPAPMLYDGARDILARLADHGIALGLCTNKPIDATRRILDQLDLTGRFQAVAGGDSYPLRKPDPMPVRGLLARLAAEPGAAVMVGDSANDIAAGRAAGVMTIVVSYGYSLVAPHELGADCLVDHLGQIATVLAPRLRSLEHIRPSGPAIGR